MNYSKLYIRLIEKRQQTKLSLEEYGEFHHIEPKCLGGSDLPNNLVKMTAREHYIAHWILAKIYSGTKFGYKLASAFNRMQNSNHGEYTNARGYEVARKLYSENHPCKNEEIKNKLRIATNNQFDKEGREQHSDIMSKYYQSEEYLSKRVIQKQETEKRQAEKRIIDNEIVELVCGCGCNETFKKKRISKAKCKIGHKINKRSPESYKKAGETLSATLNLLSKEQMRDRIKKSTGTADHSKRGEAISLGKRGKKTNQKELEIQKYGSMSEDEFNSYIENRTQAVRTAMINKRKLYFARNNNS